MFSATVSVRCNNNRSFAFGRVSRDALDHWVPRYIMLQRCILRVHFMFYDMGVASKDSHHISLIWYIQHDVFHMMDQIFCRTTGQ